MLNFQSFNLQSGPTVLNYLFTLQPHFYTKMQVVKHISDLQTILNIKREEGLKIGFVPTMGALHEGHLSLVMIAGEQSNFVVVSIFVNPTQFNDKGDLDRYPRDLQKDVDLLSTSACQLIFAPEPEEIYPEPDTRQFNFGQLEQVMEGKFRPGHFNGVAQVVSRLFDIVQPDKAFFGQKDFQQLAIINEMVRKFNLPVEIVSCPIIRETNGLAMSSRNMLLSPEQRLNAVHISATLFEAANKTGELSVEELCEWVINRINKNEFLNTEYFEIVNEMTLLPVKSWDENCKKFGCIAVHCGKIRLIDNMEFGVRSA
ncbi:pantoate--beta-alanine ligase [Aquipluma nitroreducens]|uniref:Pantothenate synthetase n=2 Tax=Aquipluma nitroreducens TaxID=2010828 RepID=A0A5K7S8M5_9BACT|nr:pantoate--beta-alanine ligase [Aquipluma nitroreducens]